MPVWWLHIYSLLYFLYYLLSLSYGRSLAALLIAQHCGRPMVAPTTFAYLSTNVGTSRRRPLRIKIRQTALSPTISYGRSLTAHLRYSQLLNLFRNDFVNFSQCVVNLTCVTAAALRHIRLTAATTTCNSRNILNNLTAMNAHLNSIL